MRLALDRWHAAVWRIRIEPGAAEAAVIDREGVAALTRLLDEAAADDGCRVLVLEGSDGSFCQGMDLGYLVAHPDEDVSEEAHGYAACLDRLAGARQLVIAAVDGSANGGGVGLAAAADVVVATSRSTFGLPEVVLGLLPAIVLPVLLERMSPQKARLLALSSSVDAARAYALGLVDHLVDDGPSLERKVRAVIKHGLRCAPHAVGGLKALSGRQAALERAAALTLGAETTARTIAEPERLAAVRAFLEGEPLPWFDSYRPPKERS